MITCVCFYLMLFFFENTSLISKSEKKLLYDVICIEYIGQLRNNKDYRREEHEQL